MAKIILKLRKVNKVQERKELIQRVTRERQAQRWADLERKQRRLP